MKLQLLSNDEVLAKKLKESNLFDEVVNVFDREKLNADCIVISDTFFPYTDLQDYEFKENQHVFYMLSSQCEEGLEKSIKIICDSRDIVLIPPRLTVEQIVDIITKTFNKTITDNSKVVTLFSTLSNIGTTSTTLSIAMSLSEVTKAKVGVLLLNAWDKGTYQLEYKGEYIDSIKPMLENQTIKGKNGFLSLFHMVKEDSLYILGGNRYTKLERLYTKESISYLINMSKKYFDVVLIDAGSHFDNANMVQALYESDMRVLVITQQPKGIDRFNTLFEEILYPLGYTRSDFVAVINRFIDKSQYPSPRLISEQLDMLVISTIYELEDNLYSEIEQKSLYEYDDLVYNNSIMNITKPIISLASLEYRDGENEKKSRRWSIFG